MHRKRLARVSLATGLTLTLTAMAAEKPATLAGASDSMLANTCAGCHGTNGASRGPAAPTIAGLSPDYFTETMEGFADGSIPSTIMGRIAKGYTEEEYRQLARFYSAKPFAKAKQPFDKKLVATGAKLHDKYCEKCHADGGTSAEDDAGVLAGQWSTYLRWQLTDFKAGKREMSKKMRKKMEKLLEREGEKGLAALVSYYASQQQKGTGGQR